MGDVPLDRQRAGDVESRRAARARETRFLLAGQAEWVAVGLPSAAGAEERLPEKCALECRDTRLLHGSWPKRTTTNSFTEIYKHMLLPDNKTSSIIN